jgi:hypothetical protein
MRLAITEKEPLNMKVFTHGSVVNFDRAAREMRPADLDRLLKRFREEHERILLGSINLTEGKIYLYGHLKSIQIDDSANRCEFVFTPMEGQPREERILHTVDELEISHDACFDIEDDEQGVVQVQVAYVTFAEPETANEITYFLVDPDSCSDALACVAEFWGQVHEVGRDVDFRVTGCSAYDLSFIQKMKENPTE